jgi:acid stress-induced BolA-like protein IbaG/YrbA
LEEFCRDYTGRETDWHVETWLHPITRSVEAAVVMPEFAQLGITKRQNVIYDYLKDHLPQEHSRHHSLTMALTPEEYEETEWVEPTLSLAPT